MSEEPEQEENLDWMYFTKLMGSSRGFHVVNLPEYLFFVNI